MDTDYSQKLEIRADTFTHKFLAPALQRSIERAGKKVGMNSEQSMAVFAELFALKQVRPVSGRIEANPLDDD